MTAPRVLNTPKIRRTLKAWWRDLWADNEHNEAGSEGQ